MPVAGRVRSAAPDLECRMLLNIDVHQYRHPTYPVQPWILERWSPRAMSGEPLSAQEIGSLFEAARWAPSAGNSQPWRLLYATRTGPHWQTFLDLLVEGNRRWAQHAGLLAVVTSRTLSERDGKPAPTYAYSTGSAWMALALQGVSMGLVVHGMAGFDYEKARRDLAVPEEFAVQAMLAVGRQGRIEDLPPDLQEREKPSGRKEVAEIAWEGGFETRPPADGG